jgi:hypothetical protein
MAVAVMALAATPALVANNERRLSLRVSLMMVFLFFVGFEGSLRIVHSASLCSGNTFMVIIF